MPAGYSFGDGYLKYLAWDNADGSFDWRTFDVERDGAKLQPFMDVFSPTSTDLSKLRARGGKLILYHGWADEQVTPYASLDFYSHIKARQGQVGTDDVMRLFMMPGIAHCMGGSGAGNHQR